MQPFCLLSMASSMTFYVGLADACLSDPLVQVQATMSDTGRPVHAFHAASSRSWWRSTHKCDSRPLIMTAVLRCGQLNHGVLDNVASIWMSMVERPQLWHDYYFVPGRGVKYCDQRVSVSVCPFFRLHISKTRTHFPQIFFIMLPVVMTRSSSDGNAIRYELTVLGMTSSFHIMERMGQNQTRHVCFVQFARWRQPGRNLPSPTASCIKCSRRSCCEEGWRYLTPPSVNAA